MISGIFDSHAHYDSKAFDEDRYELLSSMKEKGVSNIVNCASDIASSLVCLELADDFDYIYAACGIHPHETAECTKDFIPMLKKLCVSEKCVAVGEIGLDYHYDFSPRDVQIEAFEKQVLLAKELDMPVIVHDREAHEDVMTILKKHRPKGVVHCFSGSVELARETVKLGMYIGLGGAVTFKNARKPVEVAAYVPEDRLLVETDCPYMTPVPNRGKRNDSSYIPDVLEVIANVRGTDAQRLAEITADNARRLFSIK